MRLPRKLLQFCAAFPKVQSQKKENKSPSMLCTLGLHLRVGFQSEGHFEEGGCAVEAGSEESSNGCEQLCPPGYLFHPWAGSKGGPKIPGWKFQEGSFQSKRETCRRWNKLPFEVMFSGTTQPEAECAPVESACLDGAGSWPKPPVRILQFSAHVPDKNTR